MPSVRRRHGSPHVIHFLMNSLHSIVETVLEAGFVHSTTSQGRESGLFLFPCKLTRHNELNSVLGVESNSHILLIMKYCKLSLVTLISYISSVAAFAPSPGSNKVKTSLQVSVDPEVVTKKEYEDICGVNFDEESLDKRLERTSYLYPKHVEVVEDLAPMVDRMVDEIVSNALD